MAGGGLREPAIEAADAMPAQFDQQLLVSAQICVLIPLGIPLSLGAPPPAQGRMYFGSTNVNRDAGFTDKSAGGHEGHVM